MDECKVILWEQNNEEWLRARRGKITGSGVYQLMKSGRKKDEVLGKTAKEYIMSRYASGLVDSEPEITSTAMEWGKVHEDEARQLYKTIVVDNISIEEVGFIVVDGFEDIAGTSPDGLVIDINSADDIMVQGCIEIKCPFNTSNHVETLINKKIPEKSYDAYYAQCQMNMLSTNTQWCDFISYDPRMSDVKLRIAVVRIERDDEFISELVSRLGMVRDIFNQFNKEINE